MSTIKVDGIRSNSASSDAITLASDGTCTANITNKPNRNLIINGAMQVAQRGTSSTSSGYQTLDRFQLLYDNITNSPTQAQVDVASGTTPYTLGFRKAFKITNGDQTIGADDRLRLQHVLEAQDIANSGWNYTSTSSYITLSFWIKSSVAQNFFIRLQTQDGTSQNYVVETGSLTADTWTKITKSIPGNSNLQFDNDSGAGLLIDFGPFYGTNFTGTRPLNAWAAYAGATRFPDFPTTWFDTNDATLEITGVQLEVGDTATDFEHRSFGQEVLLCQRYYETTMGPNQAPATTDGSVSSNWAILSANDSATMIPASVNFKVSKRVAPSMSFYNPSNGNSGKCNVQGGEQTVSAVYVGINNIGRMYIGSSGTAGNYVTFNYEASAEL